MRTTSLLVAATMALIGSSGCIPTSIQPLYDDKDLLFDPALVGVWKETEDSKESWMFDKAGEKEYQLLVTDADGATGRFEAHLLKLGDALFLDLFPGGCGDSESKCSGFYQIHLQPMHSFLKISGIEPILKMEFFDLKWLSTYLKENPQSIRHERIGPENEDQRIILTASTRELQAFVLKHLDTPGAFGDKPMRLERRNSKP